MSRSHSHDPNAGTQNQGNTLGDRSCIRQSKLYRMYESGNDVKSILGMNNLVWKTNVKEGSYQGQKVYDHMAPNHFLQPTQSRATGNNNQSKSINLNDNYKNGKNDKPPVQIKEPGAGGGAMRAPLGRDIIDRNSTRSLHNDDGWNPGRDNSSVNRDGRASGYSNNGGEVIVRVSRPIKNSGVQATSYMPRISVDYVKEEEYDDDINDRRGRRREEGVALNSFHQNSSQRRVADNEMLEEARRYNADMARRFNNNNSNSNSISYNNSDSISYNNNNNNRQKEQYRDTRPW